MQQWENEPFAAIRGLEQQVDDHQEEVFSTDSCFSIYNLSEGASQIGYPTDCI